MADHPSPYINSAEAATAIVNAVSAFEQIGQPTKALSRAANLLDEQMASQSAVWESN